MATDEYLTRDGKDDVFTRRAAPEPATFDPDKRTVEVVASTGAPIRRRDLRGEFTEKLEVSERAVDLSAFEGASVLDSHNRFGLDGVLGAVERAWVTGGELRARIRFSGREEVAPVVRDVRDGIIKNVSVGYRVEQWEDSEDGKTGQRTRKAVRWSPVELSFVPVPADPNAKVRGQETMSEHGKQDQAGGETTATTDAGQTGDTAGATSATRASMGELRSIAKAAGLDDGFVDRCANEEATPDQARQRAMEALERGTTSGQAIDPTAGRVTLVQDNDDPANVRAAMADALAARFDGSEPQGRATEFMGWDELSMGAELARRRGGRVDPRDRFAAADALLSRAGAHTAADFPALLEDAANKIFQGRYRTASPTYRRWAARRSFNDFKPHRFLRAGDFPSLKKMEDNAELTYGTLSEEREQVSADEWARGLSLGRKMLVNGEFLTATGDFAAMAATRTAADENAMVYGLLEGDGPDLSDGDPLFSTTRGNKASTGGAINVTTLAEAVAALRAMQSPDGIPLNLQPAFLICGPAKELEARQVLGNINPTSPDNVNPWAGTMELIVDANVPGNRWHVAAGPGLAPTVVYGYVAGNTGPQMRTETDFDTQALKVRLSVDFGFGAIDYRGMYLNPGN